MNLIERLFGNASFKAALPWLMLLIGVGSFSYATFGNIHDKEWMHFWDGIGKTLLASGVFALILKSAQFMGIFKEELTKLIFEPKFLSNRKDIPEYWEKVSMEMFKNKFPGISQKLLKDVKIYFTMLDILYYENCKHFIEITVSDKENGIITLKKTTKLDVVCANVKNKYPYSFGVKMPYEKDKESVNFGDIAIKINGKVHTEVEIKSSYDDKFVYKDYSIVLTGSVKYAIERQEERTYDVLFDDILYFLSMKILNKLTVEFNHPECLNIDLRKCGTLSDFNLEQQTNTFKRYRCDGLIYTQQGYYYNIKFKKQ